ncbi:arginine repressor [Lapidilactobacillus wuchangensis]|uniref:arginine repressor n=1 Tax=Lapidilactobacillus wuchangensis TaxID=2486001 RepID=UPI000F793C00|nr:DNA-binding protein [Lapidilactobacillus wuchangensis]
MKKQLRQQLIIQAIQTGTIQSQADLVQYLAQQGYQVTQATISRDINELNLIKVATNHGLVYRVAEQKQPATDDQTLRDLFENAHVQLAQQDNLISLQTAPGSGPMVAAALKQLHWSEVFMVMDNDDGVLLILKSEPAAINRIWERLTQLI